MKYLSLLMVFVVSGCLFKPPKPNAPCTTDCATFNFQVLTGSSQPNPFNSETSDLTRYSFNSIGISSRLLSKQFLNSNGKVIFHFKNSAIDFNRIFYIVDVKTSPQFLEGRFRFDGITKADTILDGTLHIPFRAFLNLRVENFMLQTQSDILRINTSYLSLNSPNIYHEYNSINGFNQVRLSSFDTPSDKNTYNLSIAAEIPVFIKVFKRKNGVESTTIDTIIVNKGATRNYTVVF